MSMTFDEWVPVFAALTTAVAGLIVWTLQKRREREEQGRQRKQLVYEALLMALSELPTHNAAPLYVESQLAWLYASDEVLAVLSSLFAGFRTPEPFTGRAELLAKLLLAMRKDVFPSTSVTADLLRDAFESGHPPVQDLQEYIERRRRSLKVSEDGKKAP
jgi:hypothetical protein